MDLALSIPSFKFALESKRLRFFLTFIALGSMMPGYAKLTSLLILNSILPEKNAIVAAVEEIHIFRVNGESA